MQDLTYSTGKVSGSSQSASLETAATLKNPIESDEILNMKMEMLSKLDFDYLITSNPGCYLQLEKGRLQNNKNYKIIQLVEFIDELI